MVDAILAQRLISGSDLCLTRVEVNGETERNNASLLFEENRKKSLMANNISLLSSVSRRRKQNRIRKMPPDIKPIL